MASGFCPLGKNNPHVALQVERYYAFRYFDDPDEHGAELTRIWKAKLALGCPICARYRKHGNVSVCGRCQKLRRAVRQVEMEIISQIPTMLLEWRNSCLSVEAHKVYKRAKQLAAQSRRVRFSG